MRWSNSTASDRESLVLMIQPDAWSCSPSLHSVISSICTLCPLLLQAFLSPICFFNVPSRPAYCLRSTLWTPIPWSLYYLLLTYWQPLERLFTICEEQYSVCGFFFFYRGPRVHCQIQTKNEYQISHRPHFHSEIICKTILHIFTNRLSHGLTFCREASPNQLNQY